MVVALAFPVGCVAAAHPSEEAELTSILFRQNSIKQTGIKVLAQEFYMERRYIILGKRDRLPFEVLRMKSVYRNSPR